MQSHLLMYRMRSIAFHRLLYAGLELALLVIILHIVCEDSAAAAAYLLSSLHISAALVLLPTFAAELSTYCSIYVDSQILRNALWV